MLRAMLVLVALLLSVSIGNATALSDAVSDVSKVVVRGPVYRYSIKEGAHVGVCTHMLRVFNNNFTHLWNAPPMPWSKTDLTYSANSKYAFPLLPGVRHSTRATFEMRFSAQPTSPDFSAIHWKEGMGTPGGCPAGAVCPGEEPEPILVGHFDFDNDGTVDTVIQQAFFRGYRLASKSQQYLIVWRNQMLTIQGVADLWKLSHPKNPALNPIIMLGMYFRPFSYMKHTYVAQYVQDFGEPEGANVEPVPIPWTQPPRHEDMLIQQYSFAGKRDGIGRPKWTIDTICDFKMTKLNNGQESEHGH